MIYLQFFNLNQNIITSPKLVNMERHFCDKTPKNQEKPLASSSSLLPLCPIKIPRKLLEI